MSELRGSRAAEEFAIAATVPALDAFTAALGRADLGVRRLERVSSPLEELFFAMTSEDETAERRRRAPGASRGRAAALGDPSRAPQADGAAAAAAARWCCLLGPFAFALLLRSPER